MNIVQTDEIPLKRGLEHRGGIFHGRIMVEGAPGALDNFQLSFGQMGGDFNSPRHRPAGTRCGAGGSRGVGVLPTSGSLIVQRIR